MGSDFWLVVRWWGTLFLIGTIAYPLTKRLFSSWFDNGYLFAKAVGMLLVTYLVYLSGMFHLFPFTTATIFGSIVAVFVFGMAINVVVPDGVIRHEKGAVNDYMKKILIAGLEELFFFGALLFWAWIKGHEPSIHNLEKFMDYGFTKSILNSTFFPPNDMWYAGFPVNYYYFGHTVMAMLTKLSGIDLAYTFNIMLATLFAFTLTMSFSIAYQLFGHIERVTFRVRLVGAIVTSYIVTLGGNLQTIYAFTKGYIGDNPPPFWTLLWNFNELGRLSEGLERYWYANATRFIPFTIHEFPSYSFVVSDVHGHVLSLPFVLLAIAMLISIFGLVKRTKETGGLFVFSRGQTGATQVQKFFAVGPYVFYGLLASVLLMTNALDGPIYAGLFCILILFFHSQRASELNQSFWDDWPQFVFPIGIVSAVAGIASIPFLLHFSSFVNGLAINCPPAFLANHRFGPFLFEGVEKCQHSPLWMMALLWGFFIYCGLWFCWRFLKQSNKLEKNTKDTRIQWLLVVMFIFCCLLIIFPEFFYFKDIYPQHFRSNTMFKLGYQAFIMFGLISGYAITWLLTRLRTLRGKGKGADVLFFIVLLPLLFLVVIYPIFSVRSYFDSLRTYEGLYGLTWLNEQYPSDFAGIQFLNARITAGDPKNLPVIVEADGDSYTDYARYSAFTGLPAVVGWPVHEWLWRGSYDVVAPRRDDVSKIYTSDDLEETRAILQKYHVRYIIVGTLEWQKYPNLRAEKFILLGRQVFYDGVTSIYEVTSP